MQTTISNEFLTVTIDTHGAEVVSVKNSKGEELIWQADPTIWDRHSPVLFPWAGRLANGELIHNGKHYSGGQHGFIRDLEHILKQNNGISAQLMFRADEETKTLRFPFDFEFTSVFTLDGHGLVKIYGVHRPDFISVLQQGKAAFLNETAFWVSHHE